jgi:hypothetical protein
MTAQAAKGSLGERAVMAREFAILAQDSALSASLPAVKK